MRADVLAFLSDIPGPSGAGARLARAWRRLCGWLWRQAGGTDGADGGPGEPFHFPPRLQDWQTTTIRKFDLAGSPTPQTGALTRYRLLWLGEFWTSTRDRRRRLCSFKFRGPRGPVPGGRSGFRGRGVVDIRGRRPESVDGCIDVRGGRFRRSGRRSRRLSGLSRTACIPPGGPCHLLRAATARRPARVQRAWWRGAEAMLFTTLNFGFSVVELAPVLCFPRPWRRYLLLAASLFFYMAWKAKFVVLILGLITVDYLAALWIIQKRGRGGTSPCS